MDSRWAQHASIEGGVIFITSSIGHSERLLTDIENAFRNTGLRLALTKTTIMQNWFAYDAFCTFSELKIYEWSSYAYQRLFIIMKNG